MPPRGREMRDGSSEVEMEREDGQGDAGTGEGRRWGKEIMPCTGAYRCKQ